MSERERWIVYPLLFLALGSALRDKMLKQTTAERIICEKMYCESLSLVDKQGRQLALLENGTLQLDAVRANNMDASNYLRRGQPLALSASGGGKTTIPVPQLLDFMRAAGILPAADSTPANQKREGQPAEMSAEQPDALNPPDRPSNVAPNSGEPSS